MDGSVEPPPPPWRRRPGPRPSRPSCSRHRPFLRRERVLPLEAAQVLADLARLLALRADRGLEGSRGAPAPRPGSRGGHGRRLLVGGLREQHRDGDQRHHEHRRDRPQPPLDQVVEGRADEGVHGVHGWSPRRSGGRGCRAGGSGLRRRGAGRALRGRAREQALVGGKHVCGREDRDLAALQREALDRDQPAGDRELVVARLDEPVMLWIRFSRL